MKKKGIMKEITKEDQINGIIQGIIRLCPDYDIIVEPCSISIKATFLRSEVDLEDFKKEKR